MQEIFNFLKDYWQIILGAILFVVSLIISIVRKRPINEICTHLYSWCITAVNAVEGEVLGSKRKLESAISIVKNYFISHYPGANFELYVDTVQNLIEKILTTPQKKGG